MRDTGTGKPANPPQATSERVSTATGERQLDSPHRRRTSRDVRHQRKPGAVWNVAPTSTRAELSAH
ncbi:hypothetical protein FHR84_003417 [Actinopolyspora biskrensis]|uniref:Uncharacterized protein n=1 Tax=Actinopolyspora biskrensis TaxID=1470178 RepID=A0A852Z0Q1_9ACTN|nr:hypothetical protein [Actinopolyspora biskrensis]